MDETGMDNPLFSIMGRENNSNNKNFLDETGIQNPLFIGNNSNNNNFLDETGLQNPIRKIMNKEEEDIDNMLDEISKVILNLQTDMTKVLTGINKLNELTTKIKLARLNKKNNMNNNNMRNNMNNNMMNNMMNNMNNNMMNNMNNNMNNNMLNNNKIK